MTRSDFINDITRWWELIDFCLDVGCEVCEDIVSNDDLDGNIEDDIENAANEELGWVEIRNRLNDIETGYDYYVNDGYMIYNGLDDEEDFDEYKNEVIDWMDSYGDWDEEDTEDDDFVDEENSYQEEEDNEPPMEAEFPVTELISLCIVDITVQKSADEEKQRKEQAEIDRALAELLPL